MTGIIEQYYAPLLKKHGFVPEPDNDQYGPLGLCWKLSPEVGEGSYWTYGQRDLFDIKIHNFSFNKDFMLEFDLRNVSVLPVTILSPVKSCRRIAGCQPDASKPMWADTSHIK